VQRLPQTFSIIESGIEQGLHTGAQLYVSIDGQPVADESFGTMQPDSIILWLSCCKPFMPVALAQLREKGQLDVDDPVIRVIPEFGANGKSAITLKHILTHTAGLRFVAFDWPNSPWDKIIETICAARIEKDWEVGKKAGYSPFASWFILAEIVRRIDGRMYDDYVRDEIFLPLGMRGSWMTMPPDVYRANEHRLTRMLDTKKSPPSETGDDTEAAAGALRPSGGARGPVRELARFYEMLLHDGESILTRGSVQFITSPHRAGMFDHTFGHNMDWSLGFILNTTDPTTMPYGYGPHASRQTFGHSGAESSCAFCDSAHKLVVAWSCNGQPGDAKHQQRQRAINGGIYEDLGLP
jgi:CubicO group peptidase (beta-lactamase class C family)